MIHVPTFFRILVGLPMFLALLHMGSLTVANILDTYLGASVFIYLNTMSWNVVQWLDFFRNRKKDIVV